jgi:glycosyltransferase involved in cell wall biosynthesis
MSTTSIPGAGSTPTSSEERSTVLASIIVPARNPGEDLSRLLAALSAQTIPTDQFEVIVADDGSTDGVIDAAAKAHSWVRVTVGTPKSSYAARNRAVGLATAPVLAFCDADCVPEPEWLENGLRALADAEVVAGLIRFKLPERRTIWTLLDMDSFLDQERAVRGGHAVTANLFLRRELFERVGRFDDSLPEYGDYELVAKCVSAGARLAFARDVVVHHPTRDDRRPFLHKVWIMNWWYGARESRDGRVPFLMRPRAWVPFVRVMRSRRWVGRSLVLDRRRLSEHGVHPSRREHLLGLAMIYLVLPYYSNVAQLGGWWAGRKLRGDGTAA